ncbi:MAG: tRNA (adenosine(37)-N6)-threonylcarbamoyltransferase complex transferase subunit TsaD [Candidatus Andersenbacteria bacterium RIFCSPHIGHO2_12_FULL_45_11b]|uniref:N(6)-L-threonylcarbamoyladenine synthase n=1 Tax=Candidatus Andersenbacteria bacterium RIFCSPHIGHO2_12_FULL_45_11b TaxID=1797282 RepID=A0A1G1X5D2_9BACT|nr:MAG: tRNA (adenosine(37)-N6)-threonylcarbamoyltransferase complex transferase subunit TsaD [Candidatus Andersenbacteria bacterium RIFCSPHIGHO2_12_FULL_45_11b]
MIQVVLEKSGIQRENIDAIAVTTCPGLMPSLAVGVQAARALSYVWNKPIVPVHHIEGHVYSALLVENEPKSYQLPAKSWPALAIIISGGHTMFIRMKSHLQYEVIGETRDDAIGEVFDKVARMLGLGYPGGPKISKLAEAGNPNAFHFPRPMEHSHNLDFSYSGLKTAVLYQVCDLGDAIDDQQKSDIAASFQQAICDSVAAKLEYAVAQTEYKTILFAGGVAANTALRTRIAQIAERHATAFHVAPLHLCGDNAVMIGEVGVYAFEAGRIKTWREIDATAKISIEEFSK